LEGEEERERERERGRKREEDVKNGLENERKGEEADPIAVCLNDAKEGGEEGIISFSRYFN